jgi:hypothetical protein
MNNFNTNGPALDRSRTRTQRAFSDPTSNRRKRNAERVALEKNEKYINYSQKALSDVEKSIACHEKNGWFCTKPEKLFPKAGMKYEPSLSGLKKYKSFLNSSIKFTSNSIGTRKKRINSISPTLYPLKQGYQNQQGNQNHKRNNFLNPNNMEHSSLPNVIHRRNNFLNPNNMQHSSLGGGKRRTRRIRRTRRHR